MRPGTPPPEPLPEPPDWVDAHPVLEVLHGKWTLPIMDALHRGPRRHRDLAQAIGPRVSNKVLSATLRRLEQQGLIARDDTDPHAVVYSLTPRGQSLHPLVAPLSRWSREHRRQPPTPDG